MKDIFVTATNTDIGKTYATVKLLHHFASLGYRVGAFKPIETGVQTTPNDGLILLKICKKLNLQFKDITIDDICPIQLSLPAAPYVANNGKNIDLTKIQRAYEKLKKHCDILIIEGAGGLFVPIGLSYFMIDLITLFDAHTLLITHDRLGSINDTLLSLEILKNRGISYSWSINRHLNRTDFIDITLPFYKDKFNKVLSLQENLDELAEELITECNRNRDRG